MCVGKTLHATSEVDVWISVFGFQHRDLEEMPWKHWNQCHGSGWWRHHRLHLLSISTRPPLPPPAGGAPLPRGAGPPLAAPPDTPPPAREGGRSLTRPIPSNAVRWSERLHRVLASAPESVLCCLRPEIAAAREACLPSLPLHDCLTSVRAGVNTARVQYN